MDIVYKMKGVSVAVLGALELLSVSKSQVSKDRKVV